ncbi:MAG: hypothetical protein JWM41_1101 [Gemmatimonadetes bacterium]|nr:hypothetical protein [Gemmatimonadota bacterium]
MSARRRHIEPIGVALVLAFWSHHAAAQSRAAACGPVRPADGAAIEYVREGGNIRPFTVALYADGTMRTGDTSVTQSAAAAAAHVDSTRVAALVHLARTSGFWRLPANPIHKPPRNPDAARYRISVRTTCGAHASAYPLSAAPKVFRELLARVATLSGVQP